MFHTFEGGGIRDVVLKACMNWPWSKDGDKAVYVIAGGGAICDELGAPDDHGERGVGAPGGHGMGEEAPYGHGDGGDIMA
jgi:hypothetical protein